MIGQTISHYKILEKLGEGGMGIVYKAQDLKLDRFVALKFLHQQAATDTDAKKRFVIEAKSASSLDHSNICTIHEIDETTDGRLFIVMPCYEGDSLGEKLKKGTFEIGEAVDIVRQAAAGLAKAHEKGIVHRDIKPGNILVTRDNQVKIVDFGLAKLTGQSKVTRTGMTVGTLNYMSPEQVKGAAVDARSDVFSLGVVLYELLAGRPPFSNETEAAVLYSIVNQEAPPLSEFRDDIPEELARIVEKALEKAVERRYQDAAEFRDDLESFRVDFAMGKPMPAGRIKRRRRSRKPAGRRPLIIVLAAIGLILAAVTATILWQKHWLVSSEALALAVVDFRDLASPDDPTVSAGMTGLVHVGLVESSPVRVISPEYLYDLRRRLFDTARGPIEETQALEVARKAGATLLLSGQMGKLGGTSYVTWRLVDVSSGRSLAARRVEGDNQVLIADQVISEVLPLLAKESGVEATAAPPSVSALTTTSSEAYSHFVAGTMAREEARFDDAVRELRAAVQLDSTFALALFELSRVQDLDLERETAGAYAKRAWELRTGLGIKDRMRLEAWRESVDNHDIDAIKTYREMLTRWPDDREVLTDLSDILYYNWYYVEAASIAGRAFTLYPDHHPFANTYGNSLAYTGRSVEALDIARAYVSKHPDNPNAWDDLGLRYLEAGLPDSAETSFRRALEIDADFWWSRLGLGYCSYCRGDAATAIETFERILDSGTASPSDRISLMTDVSFWPGLALLYAETGRLRKALGFFDEAWEDFAGPKPERESAGRIQLLLRIDGGVEALRLARELSTRAVAAYDRLYAKHFEARALVGLDSLDAARSTLAKLRAIETETASSQPYLELRVAADIALAAGDADGALEALNEMQRDGLPPGGLKDIERREDLARAQEMAGRLKEAVATHNELLRIYGSHALSHYELGKLHEQLNHTAKAAEHYTRFLEMWSLTDDGLPQVADARRRLNAVAK